MQTVIRPPVTTRTFLPIGGLSTRQSNEVSEGASQSEPLLKHAAGSSRSSEATMQKLKSVALGLGCATSIALDKKQVSLIL